jgi:hypothetical protein
LVTGGRRYGDLSLSLGVNDPRWPQRKKEYEHVFRTLEKLAEKYSEEAPEDDENWMPNGIKIVCGGSTGADTAALDYAETNWLIYQDYQADWTTFGKAAGPIRNAEMLAKEKVDLVVAFPGGPGTLNMKRLARAAGVEVLEVQDI